LVDQARETADTASTMKNSTTEHNAIVALVALSKW